jgi:hypothetical protein
MERPNVKPRIPPDKIRREHRDIAAEVLGPGYLDKPPEVISAVIYELGRCLSPDLIALAKKAAAVSI